MTFYKWSQIAAADATADSSINWQEGQAPSSINDSARAMMAALAKYRDDIAGSLTTGGTSTAYTVSSFQAFDSLTRLNGQTIAFTPHVTNGAVVTLNVDGLGAKPLRPAPATDLLAGMLVQGTPYTCTYSNADAAFYLRDFYASPYGIPLGASIDYWGNSSPHSAFALAYGQAISRATYSGLFALFGTAYGSGDGATTFNIPDLRGRVIAGKDDMGGSAASRLTSSFFGTSAAALGAVGGGESKTLLTANLPPYTPAGSISVSGGSVRLARSAFQNGASGALICAQKQTETNNLGTFDEPVNGMTASFLGTAQGGASTPVSAVQPTIICNKLLRII